MAVDNPNTVDMVSDGPSGSLVLIIADHLDWGDSMAHQQTLQTKIHCYLAFVESGQMRRHFPEAAGRPVVIQVVAKSLPDDAGAHFLDRARVALGRAGYALEWRRLE